MHSAFESVRQILVCFIGISFVFTNEAAPLSVHPENPHYFLYRGKPTILITSAEHYGAVLNLDFNYVPYLDELRARKLNLTRAFTGAYVEPQGAFNITRNTLAPAAGRFISPWARSSTPGYANSGNKFDLTKWDEAYFRRLKSFVSEADKRGVVVELNLFCPFYEESQWSLSPQNASNNINGIGNIPRTNVYTLDKHGGLLEMHEGLTRKLVKELNGFDNLYYEICNEPYFGGVTVEWQHHIAELISDTEKPLKKKHLISRNVANGAARVTDPHPAVSIYNFHYASPPNTVAQNYGLKKVIGDNETGFRGTNDLPYRIEAWDFILAGGGLYNNLDYSFATGGFENGTFIQSATDPGGGNPGFREQMSHLVEFMGGLPFIKMRPDNSIIQGGVPRGWTARAFVEPGKHYALYLAPSAPPKDEFSIRWNGRLGSKFSEEYTIHAVSNGGVRVRVNGKTIIDNWTSHSEREDTGTVKLIAGQKVSIETDYYQSGAKGIIKLSWSSPSLAKEIIPNAAFLALSGVHGIDGKYYTGTKFDKLRLTRTDANVDFNWSDSSPFSGPATRSDQPQAATLSLSLPAGSYSTEWLNPRTGVTEKRESVTVRGGPAKFTSPPFMEDIALRIKAR